MRLRLLSAPFSSFSMSSKQAMAVKASRERHGIISKTIRIPGELNKEFVAACRKLGITQSAVYTRAMMQVIEKANDETEKSADTPSGL